MKLRIIDDSDNVVGHFDLDLSPQFLKQYKSENDRAQRVRRKPNLNVNPDPLGLKTALVQNKKELISFIIEKFGNVNTFCRHISEKRRQIDAVENQGLPIKSTVVVRQNIYGWEKNGIPFKWQSLCAQLGIDRKFFKTNETVRRKPFMNSQGHIFWRDLNSVPKDVRLTDDQIIRLKKKHPVRAFNADGSHLTKEQFLASPHYMDAAITPNTPSDLESIL